MISISSGSIVVVVWNVWLCKFGLCTIIVGLSRLGQETGLQV